MVSTDFEIITTDHEWMAGFDAAHDDAYFGVTELVGGLADTALVKLGLHPCDYGSDPVTRVEVLTGACVDGVQVAELHFESFYTGLEKFVDGYRAYGENVGVTA